MKNKKMLDLKNLLETAEIALQQVQSILAELTGSGESGFDIKQIKNLKKIRNGAEQIIEGVFDGQNMVGPDAKEYAMPANYASKSKLVEGDVMKLTILPDGTFVYKQIGPVTRERYKGKLVYDEKKDEYRVMTEWGKNYKLLTASVTYFKGESGDEAIILVPQGGESVWAAVENIIKEGSEKDDKADDFAGDMNFVNKLNDGKIVADDLELHDELGDI